MILFVHFQQITFQPGCRDLAGIAGLAASCGAACSSGKKGWNHGQRLLASCAVFGSRSRCFCSFFCWKDSLGRINHGADYDSVKQQCLQNLIFPEPKIWMWNNSQFSHPVSWLKRVWIFKVAKKVGPHFSRRNIAATAIFKQHSRPPSLGSIASQPQSSRPTAVQRVHRACAAYDVSLYEFLGSRVMAWCVFLLLLRYLSDWPYIIWIESEPRFIPELGKTEPQSTMVHGRLLNECMQPTELPLRKGDGSFRHRAKCSEVPAFRGGQRPDIFHLFSLLCDT